MKYSNLPLITLIIISQSILQAQNLVEQITNIGGNKDGVKQYELNIEKIDNSLFFPSYYSTNSTYPSKPSLTKYDLITKQSSLVFRNNEVVREPYPLFKLTNGNILFWSKPGDFGSIRNLFNLDAIDKKITLVSDKLINGPQCSQIIDNNLYFSCTTGLPDEFWVSNGTISGTYTLKDIEGNPIKFPCGFTKYRDSLILFTAKTKYGQELYITDGINSEKTKLIKDINPSTTANGAGGLVNYKDRVYFTGDNQVNGNEIWLTDGTTNNTQMLKDINPGPGSSIPSLIPTKETLLILAENPTIGKQFWSSDGTMSGTSAITNFTGQSSNFLTYWIEELDSILVLAIKIDMGYELYKYSKRLRSLELIKDINPGIASGVGYDYLKHKGIIYFIGNNPTYGYELWRTDGTSIGTYLINDLDPSLGTFGSIELLKIIDDKLYFSQNIMDVGRELYSYNTQQTSSSIEIENSETQKSIFPNPTTGTVYCNCFENTAFVDLYSTSGQKTVIKVNQNSVDLSNLNSGMFFIVVRQSNESKVLKIIKL